MLVNVFLVEVVILFIMCICLVVISVLIVICECGFVVRSVFRIELLMVL